MGGCGGWEGKGLPVKNKGEKWGEERMETALHAQHPWKNKEDHQAEREEGCNATPAKSRWGCWAVQSQSCLLKYSCTGYTWWLAVPHLSARSNPEWRWGQRVGAVQGAWPQCECPSWESELSTPHALCSRFFWRRTSATSPPPTVANTL